MRITLDVKDIPSKWYNIIPDLDFNLAPMMSSSGYPLSHHDLGRLAPSSIIEQELEREKREISMPKEVANF